MRECPITLCPLHELSHPVAFSCAPDQPYELDALCAWMEESPRNPLTGRAARVDDLVALGSARQQRESVERMNQMSLTITLNQPLLLTEGSSSSSSSVVHEYKVFRNEVKEIKAELGQLDERIRDVNKTMSVLMGEKTRIETRIEFINRQYLNRDAMPSMCPPLCIIS